MLDLDTVLEILVVLSTLAVLGLIAALRYVVVNLYVFVRGEREIITRNRDEWRSVAERALLMAHVYQAQAQRATVLADPPAKADDPA